MLVLSRRAGESIVIADSITVTILEVRGNRAKLGIIAPVETPIHRGEVQEKISHNQPVDRCAEAASNWATSSQFSLAGEL